MTTEDSSQHVFANHTEWDNRANDILVQSGALVVRSLLILNGAAVIAMLAFLSTTITADLPETYAALVRGIVRVLPMFGFGAFLAVATAGLAWFVNYAYLAAHRQVTFHDVSPYIRPKPRLQSALLWAGHLGTIFSIIAGLTSGAFFLLALTRIAGLAAGAAV